MAFQVKTKRYHGLLHTMRTMAAEDLRSLYFGFGPTLLGILPYAGISFYTYDTLKTWLMRDPWHVTPDGRLPVSHQLVVGAVAGAAAQTASYPLDVIRRRMQLKNLAVRVPAHRHTVDAFRTIWQSEGLKGLFIGLSINYVKVVPAVSVSFATYEFMKKQLDIK
jgi:hypothetical protein